MAYCIWLTNGAPDSVVVKEEFDSEVDWECLF
jgi:hypothetical protein